MKTTLPERLYTCAESRALDLCAIDGHKIPGITLMKRAGEAAFGVLTHLWPDVDDILVLCGSGNNGGDGYVLAAIAALQKKRVSVRYQADPQTLHGDAKLAYLFALREGVDIKAFDVNEAVSGKEVIVDALLGTGLQGSVREDYAAAIAWVNVSTCSVLSLDIPSGLSGDTGQCLGASVKADATITFIACKRGLFTGAAPAYLGRLFFNDLGAPNDIYAEVPCALHRIDIDVLPCLPARRPDSHKGMFGHVVVVGGDAGFGGAAIMAAEAALVIGAGKVSLMTQPEHVSAALSRRPELMVLGTPLHQDSMPHLARADVLVVGPGLGQSCWSEHGLEKALQTELPMVLDADGLTLLATRFGDYHVRGHWVLTPHPAEAARLLGCTTAEIQSDRFAAVGALQQKYRGVVVLKGAGTLIADDNSIVLANVGNAAMATAGSGDILSGLIGSFIAQGLSLYAAAKLGVCVHGRAGEHVAQGRRSLCASELIDGSRHVLDDMPVSRNEA